MSTYIQCVCVCDINMYILADTSLLPSMYMCVHLYVHAQQSVMADHPLSCDLLYIIVRMYITSIENSNSSIN